MKDKLVEGIHRASKWLLICLLIGLLSGGLSAFFLQTLSLMTRLRVENDWLLFFLPLSGFVFAFLYQRVGKNSGRGNNLIIEQANGGAEDVPLRLIPLTLFGTLSTHLFGGSVGREGTAVQMGGSVANAVGKLVKLNSQERQVLFMCGISAGFSSVFGTPLAGTFFALEVLALGTFKYEGLVPSFLAACLAHFFASLFGATHSTYSIGEIPPYSFKLGVLLLVFGILFGLTSRLFSLGLIWLKKLYTTTTL